MKCRKLIGTVPVVQSFFRKNKIDKTAQEKHIDFLIKKKVGGLWVLGTGSEDMNINMKKRVELTKIITMKNKGKVPLIIGCSFFCEEDVYEFIDKVGKLNFDAFHFMPYHPLLSLRQIKNQYLKISNYTSKKFGKPLWAYSSANWSKKINYDFIRDLSLIRGICGIKYSTSNAPDQIKAIQLNSTNFQVITAVVKQFISNLSAGVEATTTSVAGLIPESVNLIYSNFKSGNLKKALYYQRLLNNFLDSVPKTLKNDNFLGAAEEKYLLKLRGIGTGEVSSYYRAPSTNEKKILKKNFLSLLKKLKTRI
jgi:dihydrodipicolinate synthase/N-acetylneuraminate lyase